jgi:hypothetical protein
MVVSVEIVPGFRFKVACASNFEPKNLEHCYLVTSDLPTIND